MIVGKFVYRILKSINFLFNLGYAPTDLLKPFFHIGT